MTKCVYVVRVALVVVVVAIGCVTGSKDAPRVSWKGDHLGFAKYFAKRNELVRIENAPSDKWAAINTDAGADADADTGADADVGADADAITDADADTDAGGRWTLESLATSDVANKFAKVHRSKEPLFGWGCCRDRAVKFGKLCTLAHESMQHVACSVDVDAASASEGDTKCSVTDPTAEETSKDREYLYFSGDLGPLLEESTLLGDVDTKGFNVSEVSLFGDNEEDGESAAFMQNLVIGSAGAMTPLHYDGMHNFFVQVHGTRRVTVFPPEAWSGLGLYPKYHLQHRNTRINPAALPDEKVREVFPNYTEAIQGMKYEIEMKPGDVLFIPPLWFHQDEALTPSISINMWSASKKIRGLDEIWNSPIPINFEDELDDVVFMAGLYVRDVISETLKPFKKLQSDAPAEFAHRMSDRYRELHDSGDVYKTLHMKVSKQSSEFTSHDEYRRKVQEDSPPFLSIPKDYDFAKNCKPDNNKVNRLVGTQQKMAELLAVIDKLVSTIHSDKPPLALVEIYLQHYLEDLASQVVGEAHIYPFFRHCIAEYVNPLSNDP